MKYLAGEKYKLRAVVVLPDGTRFEPGEKFVYQPRAFVSEYDQSTISAIIASRYEQRKHKCLFEPATARRQQMPLNLGRAHA